MTREQKAGQTACISAVERAMHDLYRSVIITGVGLGHVETITSELIHLRVRTQSGKRKPKPLQKS